MILTTLLFYWVALRRFCMFYGDPQERVFKLVCPYFTWLIWTHALEDPHSAKIWRGIITPLWTGMRIAQLSSQNEWPLDFIFFIAQSLDRECSTWLCEGNCKQSRYQTVLSGNNCIWKKNRRFLLMPDIFDFNITTAVHATVRNQIEKVFRPLTLTTKVWIL